jgi:hypothetical protein
MVGDDLMLLLVTGAAESLGAVIQRTEVGARQSVDVALGAVGTGEALVSIFLEDKGSSTGFKGLLDRSAQLGISSRAAKPEEIEAFIAAGLGDPSGIGYVGSACQRDSRPVDSVADRGIASIPSCFGAKMEECPLQRRLYIRTGKPEEWPPLPTARVGCATSGAATPLSRSQASSPIPSKLPTWSGRQVVRVKRRRR